MFKKHEDEHKPAPHRATHRAPKAPKVGDKVRLKNAADPRHAGLEGEVTEEAGGFYGVRVKAPPKEDGTPQDHTHDTLGGVPADDIELLE